MSLPQYIITDQCNQARVGRFLNKSTKDLSICPPEAGRNGKRKAARFQVTRKRSSPNSVTVEAVNVHGGGMHERSGQSHPLCCMSAMHFLQHLHRLQFCSHHMAHAWEPPLSISAPCANYTRNKHPVQADIYLYIYVLLFTPPKQCTIHKYHNTNQDK